MTVPRPCWRSPCPGWVNGGLEPAPAHARFRKVLFSGFMQPRSSPKRFTLAAVRAVAGPGAAVRVTLSRCERDPARG